MRHRPKVQLTCLVIALVLLLGPGIAGPTTKFPPELRSHSKWVLTWRDEFNGPNGAPPDPKNWTIETGGNGWGNHELEYYTGRRQNVWQENGSLIIQAIKQPFTGSHGVHRDYTSARIATEGRFTQKYGRFEARIRIPTGRGVWPAFWILGDDCKAVEWPACGEIDIMENIGSEPAVNHGSMHGPRYSGNHALTGIYKLPNGRFTDAFHTFAIEWEPSAVRFYVDDHLYEERTPTDISGKRWVFDHPFFVILNVAVGGDFPGNPDVSTVFPQRMLVDYVRVYQRH